MEEGAAPPAACQPHQGGPPVACCTCLPGWAAAHSAVLGPWVSTTADFCMLMRRMNRRLPEALAPPLEQDAPTGLAAALSCARVDCIGMGATALPPPPRQGLSCTGPPMAVSLLWVPRACTACLQRVPTVGARTRRLSCLPLQHLVGPLKIELQWSSHPKPACTRSGQLPR